MKSKSVYASYNDIIEFAKKKYQLEESDGYSISTDCFGNREICVKRGKYIIEDGMDSDNKFMASLILAKELPKLVQVSSRLVQDGKESSMKVKLQEVLEALEGAGMDVNYYYDTKNQEILMIFDGMVNGETNRELIEEIEDGFIEDYIPLPGQYDINEYRMMEGFIYNLPGGRVQDTLETAIRGKGAFRRFKDRLYDVDLQEKWHKYRDACYERVARDWCEQLGIEIEE